MSSLSKRFGGVIAADDIDLTVRAGEIHGLIGPNGSGKTTLLNLISGIYAPNSGQIMLDGKDVTDWPRYRRARVGVARTFQGIRLFDTMTVFDNVFVAASNAGHGRREATTVADQMLGVVGMSAQRNAAVSSLPYGDQRLVEIARAIALSPKLLLLDEPVAGMAPDEMSRVAEVVLQVSDEGVGIILVEHEMEFALGLCQIISVLNFGEKIAEGPPDAIRSHPEVVRAYLGEEGDLLGAA